MTDLLNIQADLNSAIKLEQIHNNPFLQAMPQLDVLFKLDFYSKPALVLAHFVLLFRLDLDVQQLGLSDWFVEHPSQTSIVQQSWTTFITIHSASCLTT